MDYDRIQSWGSDVTFLQGPSKVSRDARWMTVTVGVVCVFEARHVAEEYAEAVRLALRTVFQG